MSLARLSLARRTCGTRSPSCTRSGPADAYILTASAASCSTRASSSSSSAASTSASRSPSRSEGGSTTRRSAARCLLLRLERDRRRATRRRSCALWGTRCSPASTTARASSSPLSSPSFLHGHVLMPLPVQDHHADRARRHRHAHDPRPSAPSSSSTSSTVTSARANSVSLLPPPGRRQDRARNPRQVAQGGDRGARRSGRRLRRHVGRRGRGPVRLEPRPASKSEQR